jgi:hypothetical protein
MPPGSAGDTKNVAVISIAASPQPRLLGVTACRPIMRARASGRQRAGGVAGAQHSQILSRGGRGTISRRAGRTSFTIHGLASRASTEIAVFYGCSGNFRPVRLSE